jgi:hypothetical protein
MRWLIQSVVVLAAMVSCGNDADDGSPPGSEASGGSASAGASSDAAGGPSDDARGGAAGAGEGGESNATQAGGAPAGAGHAGAGGQAASGDCDGALLLLVDRSLSMFEVQLPSGGTRWEALEGAILDVIDALPSARPWALKLLPEGGSPQASCGGVAPGVTVPFAAGSSEDVRSAVEAAMPDGNGTPLPVAYARVREYLASQARESSIVVLTDGAPNCSSAGEDRDAAQAELVQLAEQAATDGVRTFVIGVGADGAADFDSLDALARAGGTAPLAHPLSHLFYRGSDRAEIASSLSRIAEGVAACSVEVEQEPAHQALPFATDFEDESLAKFLTYDELVPPLPSSAVAIGAEQGQHFLSVLNSGGDALLAVAGGHEWTNAALSVKVRVAEDATADIRLRLDVHRQTWITVQLSDGSFRVRERGLGGMMDLLASANPPTLLPGTWYQLELTVKGDQVSAALDGEALGPATLTYPAGRGGLALGSLEGDVSFDDVSVALP